MKTTPQHYYMAAALITFVRPTTKDVDGLKQRHMNAIIELPRKAINAGAIDNARRAMFQRLYDEAGVAHDAIKDITFLTFSYLGHMKPADFYDVGASKRSATEH